MEVEAAVAEATAAPLETSVEVMTETIEVFEEAQEQLATVEEVRQEKIEEGAWTESDEANF